MNVRQESKSAMYSAVKRFLIQNDEILKLLPNYQKHYRCLENGMLKIETHSRAQFTNKTTKHANKGDTKVVLIASISDTSRKLFAYARNENKTGLQKSLKTSESELKLCSDEELRNIALGLYEQVQDNLGELVAYGITEESQLTLMNATNDFIEAIPIIRIAAVANKEVTQLLADGYKETDLALEEIDIILEILRTSNPTVYNQYKELRKLKGLGKNPVSLKGLVTNSSIDEPLKGAIVTIIPNADKPITAKAADIITKKSGDKGKFYIKTLSPGIYSITVAKTGYVTQTITVAIADGETADITIQLEKS